MLLPLSVKLLKLLLQDRYIFGENNKDTVSFKETHFVFMAASRSVMFKV